MASKSNINIINGGMALSRVWLRVLVAKMGQAVVRARVRTSGLKAKQMAKLRVIVFGGSGYTGAELLRLLALHDDVDVVAVSADRRAGELMDQVHGGLGALYPNLRLQRIVDIDVAMADLVFCALPHGTTQEVVSKIIDKVRVVDLSADFRLANTETYAKWYGLEHQAKELQKEAVYGLSEWARGAVTDARLVANPGCYPTSVQIPLLPLLAHDLIGREHIVIDAKSGVSGAGRSLKDHLLFNEVNEGFAAYGVGAHRHTPEIAQGLMAKNAEVSFTFTPHLVPMNRGILSTIHLAGDHQQIRACLLDHYADEAFVQVLPQGHTASTSHVRGTNNVRISVHEEHVSGRAVVVSAIDNLIKGASGQAIQNMNIMFGLAEDRGLKLAPLRP